MYSNGLDMHNNKEKAFRMNPSVNLEKIVIFQCKICKYAGKCPKSYEDHCMTHLFQSKVMLSRAIYQCDKCATCFVDKVEFSMHKLVHVRHEVSKKLKKINDARKFPSSGKYVKRFNCGECDMKFVLESTLKMHLAVHEPFPYICSCGIGYYKHNDLVAHEKLVHPEKIQIKTEVVSKVIYKDDEFNDEITYDSGEEYKSKKKKSKSKKSKTQKIKIKSKLSKGKRRIKCKYCPGDIEFKSKRDLRVHLESHTEFPYSCVMCCLKFATQDLFEEHNKRHTFACIICDKVFKSVTNREIHMRTHSKERPFTCDICNKSFTQSGSLSIHMKIHEGIKEFKCRHCDKEFISKYQMLNHERIHTGERPHVCSYCNKPFSDPSALKRHERIHTKEYRYNCDLCDKKFTDTSGLKGHKLSRHGERTYTCEVCYKKFYTRYDLQNHVVVHLDIKGYECNECGKKFSRKQYILGHLLRSHNMQRQECSDCGKKFNSTKELKRHMISSHSFVLYCSKCPKTFRFDRDFKAHKRNGCVKTNSRKG